VPPRNRRLRYAQHSVTAVVVSHDGATWLPECLAGLSQQSRPPQRVVAVDTGSDDGSAAVLRETLGPSAVVARPRDTGLGDAVQAGLDAFSGAPSPPDAGPNATEWVWVLHDDCAPADDALERMLQRAEESPSACVLGPKVVSWDSRVLLEVGVTVDSSGQRETGLEPREVDQGQHDDVGDVLAVGTAGMLVRRETWDSLGGLDRTFALGGDDIDFGWRVNASGGRVVVAPQAVVRHAAALSTRHRRADAVTASYGAAMRGHGMATVLANTSAWLVLPLALRLVVESLLRALAALLLLRSPTRARDEIVGLGMLLAATPRLPSARRSRRRMRTRPHRQLRSLLAPASWRVRRAGDALTAVFGGRAAVDERHRRRAPVETGPVADEAESLSVDDLGVLARFFTRPGVLLALGLTAVALVADRHLLGGLVHGGRLLPAPGGAADLWSAYLASWHPVELGSTTSASPFLAELGLVAGVLFGKAWLAVDILMLGAIPLAGLSAYLCLRPLSRRLPLRLWGAVAYAFVPALTGAVAGGRIDVVVAAILLPPALRASAAALAGPPRAWHRAVGAGLLLALVVAAAPVLWLAIVATLLVSSVVAGRPGIGARLLTSLGIAVVPVAVLLPLTVRVFGDLHVLVAGAGLPDTFASRRGISAGQLLLLHPGGPAQPPLWVWAPIVLAAVFGVATSRRAARFGFVAFACGLAGAAIVSRLTPPASTTADARWWSGALLLLAAAGAVSAAVAAIDAVPDALRRAAFGWRQPAVAVLVVAGLVGTTTAVVAEIARGSGRPLTDTPATILPVFAQAEAAAPTSPRVLVLRTQGDVIHYALLRSPQGLQLGDADVAAGTHEHRAARRFLAAAIADAAAGQVRAAGELAEFGIDLVVVPDDTRGRLAPLAAVPGLARVPATSTVVYRASTSAGELMVLDPADAAPATTAGALSSTAHPQLLSTPPGGGKVVVGAGAEGRLLVLAEPRSSAWHATIRGSRLAPATAFGWAQAWRLPAAGGKVTVSREGTGRPALLVAELVLVLLALALSIPTRRVDR
jgi:GT2 family glycosyltransferase